MNTRTAGVISLIAFLTALVIIVWFLSVLHSRQVEVIRIDSDSRRTTPPSLPYTGRGAREASDTTEVDDANE